MPATIPSEAAGVAGLSVEDTELPEAAGAGGELRLISLAEAVGKMKAAISARTDPDLVIAARTSAAIITDASDAATRMQAYEEAGVDALFLYGIRDLAGLETIARATSLPLIVGRVPRPVKEPAVLAANRVKILLQGHQPFAAATQAIYDTLRRLKAGEDPKQLPNLATASLMEAVSRTGDYERCAAQFLDADEIASRRTDAESCHETMHWRDTAFHLLSHPSSCQNPRSFFDRKMGDRKIFTPQSVCASIVTGRN